MQRSRMLELDARLWPFGSARIKIELTEAGPGATEVRMSEHAIAGPAKMLPDAAQALALVPRNRESLRRLADIAVNRESTARL